MVYTFSSMLQFTTTAEEYTNKCRVIDYFSSDGMLLLYTVKHNSSHVISHWRCASAEATLHSNKTRRHCTCSTVCEHHTTRTEISASRSRRWPLDFLFQTPSYRLTHQTLNKIAICACVTGHERTDPIYCQDSIKTLKTKKTTIVLGTGERSKARSSRHWSLSLTCLT